MPFAPVPKKVSVGSAGSLAPPEAGMEGTIITRDESTNKIVRIEYQPWHKEYGTVIKYMRDGRVKTYRNGYLEEIEHDDGDKELFYKVEGDQIKCFQFKSGGKAFYKNGEKYLVHREDGKTELYKQGMLKITFSVDDKSVKFVEQYEGEKLVCSQYVHEGCVLDRKSYYDLLIVTGEEEEDAKREADAKFSSLVGD